MIVRQRGPSESGCGKAATIRGCAEPCSPARSVFAREPPSPFPEIHDFSFQPPGPYRALCSWPAPDGANPDVGYQRHPVAKPAAAVGAFRPRGCSGIGEGAEPCRWLFPSGQPPTRARSGFWRRRIIRRQQRPRCHARPGPLVRL